MLFPFFLRMLSSQYTMGRNNFWRWRPRDTQFLGFQILHVRSLNWVQIISRYAYFTHIFEILEFYVILCKLFEDFTSLLQCDFTILRLSGQVVILCTTLRRLCKYNATSEIILTHYPQSGDWKDLGIYILSPVGRLYSSDNSF